jgi:glycosyltransferase involved in cell wall biosynthesis
MPHHKAANGEIVGWGPTVEEINHLAGMFDEIKHIGFLYGGFPPKSMLPYRSERIHFIPLQSSGGTTLGSKLGILAKIPAYLKIIFKHLHEADVLHVRCPSSVGLILIIFLAFLPRPKYRWVKYAGNWQPDGPEPWSYRLQRFWLKRGWHRGTVTVNGNWKDEPRHVISFLNPSISSLNLDTAGQIACEKKITKPVQLLFVGRTETAKGCGRALEISSQVLENGIDLALNIIGDGEMRPHFERMAKDRSLTRHVKFHGWLPHPALVQFYEKAHFTILPTTASEGWPKVLSEGMAYGVIPLAGSVSSIPQLLGDFGTGRALNPLCIQDYVDAILWYLSHPDHWKLESNMAVRVASQFTYEAYLQHVKDMFRDQWDLIL